MTNANPLWKTLLLATVLLVGALFALPNLFGSDPAVQISGRNAALSAEDADTVRSTLREAGFTPKFREEDERMLALFDSEDEQLKARDALLSVLDPSSATVALNLVSASPEWLRKVSDPMYLGLDLRGGVHFLMEVDMQAAIDSTEERFVADWKRMVREVRIRGTVIQHKEGVLSARFRKAEDRDQMLDASMRLSRPT